MKKQSTKKTNEKVSNSKIDIKEKLSHSIFSDSAVPLIEKLILNLVSEISIKKFNWKLWNLNISFFGFIKISSFISIFFILMLLYLGHFFSWHFFILFGVVVFTPIVCFFCCYFFVEFFYDLINKKKETACVDFLLESSISYSNDFLKNFKQISIDKAHVLSRDCKLFVEDIEFKGLSFEEAISSFAFRNSSPVITRMCSLILQGYESGKSINSVFRETAEDILETKALIRERNSLLIIEKYTIIISCIFILPALLGLVFGLSSSLNFSSGFFVESNFRTELLDYCFLANLFYLFEFCIIGSFFISFIEGNFKKVFLYCLVFVPMSFFVFFSSLSFFG